MNLIPHGCLPWGKGCLVQVYLCDGVAATRRRSKRGGPRPEGGSGPM
jgi:hypothetical protein